MARPSLPVFRTRYSVTVVKAVLPLRFTPSASVSRITLPATVTSVLPYSSHRPTLVFWIHRPVTTAPVPSEPLMALWVLSSNRPTVLPRMAKSLRLTGPGTTAGLSMNSFDSTWEYQDPAPSIVALLMASGELTVNEPCGIHTLLWAASAAAIAALNAAVESVAPVGLAP